MKSIPETGTTNYRYSFDDVSDEANAGGVVRHLRGQRLDNIMGRLTTTGGHYYLRDDLGSVVAAVDATGLLATAVSYEPFGRQNVDGSTEIPFGFIGREHDDTGLPFLRARYYAPQAGRFISEDPVGLWGGMNVYAYAANNPTTLIDPLGLRPGDPYHSAQAAAIAAIQDINPISIADNREWGGVIYERNGSYYYTWPTRGGLDRINIVEPPGVNTIGWYHTHGAHDPRYDNENFSRLDRQTSERTGIDGYLGTPSGRIKIYNPRTRTSRDITPKR